MIHSMYGMEASDIKRLKELEEENHKLKDMFATLSLKHSNSSRKKCCGRTPFETLLDGKSIWVEKNLAQIEADSHRLKNG
ncbi:MULTISPECIES: hypothetical protein [Pseudoalteromonas]|uniref:hypothetical protein n=1 Tax=Pseudoalteromonas TaxID=53246 RepID=UPI000374E747|nr:MULTISPECIES: hypothetical protein [Pseudoalteromonas]MDP4489999.1 hypothetical protein [Pseudoalteromonas piscicida]